jgi:hypothetical protein
MLCKRRVARRRGACGGACEEKCQPNPKPRPKAEPSSADVTERGVASIGVRSSENMCVEEEYVYRARILLHLHIQLENTVLRGSRAGQRFGCRNHSS